MHPRDDQSRPLRGAWRRAALRALLLGGVGTAAGATVGAGLGALLCLADGMPWVVAAWWGLRGAAGGLAAGAFLGAMSGIYHVEEAAHPQPRPAEHLPVKGAPLLARLAALLRGGAHSRN